ncbi:MULTISPECIES: sensor histidine kinase KdpD [unclassified Halomonas]|jgi:two-component system sensor histidine kinase KdpD|uniref:sensor histidine kinase n=1 Tax=Halomonadaceae TaxID=28256 RepID=UPI00111A4D96|nr:MULTISPECIES: sensor histidine kinase KdpD [unclassified Halomonas]MCG7590949.1 sensor histidine kinase KdpD [Halomonas sp. McD50-5]MCG7617061.1 sensor histidine kinase KdpD [Halomonas sp. McD50-4]TNH14715.1 sensor histidine kinase KdpD [Halomonas sp. BL6]
MYSADQRPDPNALLKAARREARGCLRVFLGAAPGVGKTYTMLRTARERAEEGDDIVIGVVESHGRADTEALCEGLSRIPLAPLQHHGRTFYEFDIDAALERKPTILLVDELAHRNIPGSRHPRRYQDIEELLDAGIDVWTTVNVQHLESLNDDVARITGIRMRETVPDALLERARDVSLVDLTPEELLERLRRGKVYIPEQARAAMEGYFNESNLNALRELAIQTMAERVDADVKVAMDASGRAGPWPVRPHLLVIITGSEDDVSLVRAAHRMAERRLAVWRAVYVDKGVASPEQQLTIEKIFSLVTRLGGDSLRLQGHSQLGEVLNYARSINATTIMVGRDGKRRWWPWSRPLAQRLIAHTDVFDIVVVAQGSVKQGRHKRQPSWIVRPPQLLATSLAVMASLGIAHLLEPWLELANLSLVFLAAVLFSAVWAGTSMAMFSAVAGFLIFNFFFTEPRLSFAMVERGQLLTVLFFFLIALVVGQLAGRGRQRLVALRASRDQTQLLLRYAEQLSIATDSASAAKVGVDTLVQCFEVPVIFIETAESASEVRVVYALPDAERLDMTAKQAAVWSWQHQKPSGQGTQTLSQQAWRLLPLAVQGEKVGMLALKLSASQKGLTHENEALIDTLVRQLSMALERTRLVAELNTTRVSEENERLRSALLSSVSHDLRTPLASIIGSTSSLIELKPQLSDSDQRELLDGILSESERLNRYIQNLLDMTRLGHGTLKIERDWVSFDDVINSALKRLGQSLKHVVVRKQWPTNLPLLYVHPALIEQALVNVLDNAQRFSPPNGELLISVHLKDEDPSVLVIKIEDEGPGISPGLREQVFDMFYSGGDGDRSAHGSGLGLAICRGMIGAHGGTITADVGANGKGTAIIITLPLLGADIGRMDEE